MKFEEMNSRQKKAYINIYHASNWLIGGLENACSDYPEDSEEYKNAYEDLNNHEMLVQTLYEMATTDLYDEGFAMSNKQAEKFLKDIRFCGKEWLMERCEKRVKKHGY